MTFWVKSTLYIFEINSKIKFILKMKLSGLRVLTALKYSESYIPPSTYCNNDIAPIQKLLFQKWNQLPRSSLVTQVQITIGGLEIDELLPDLRVLHLFNEHLLHDLLVLGHAVLNSANSRTVNILNSIILIFINSHNLTGYFTCNLSRFVYCLLILRIFTILAKEYCSCV